MSVSLPTPDVHEPGMLKKSKRKTILLVVGGLVGGCCLLAVILGLASQSSNKVAKPTIAIGQVQNSDQPSEPSTSQPLKDTQPAIPTTAPAPTEAPVRDIYKVLEKAEAGGIAVTVISVQKVEHLNLLTAETGKIYLDTEVLIENVSRDETTPYNMMYFKIKDGSAAEYTSAIDSLEPSLKSGDLAKGDKARGHIAFEIPKDTKGIVLSYEPMVLFGGYKTIRVNLEEKVEGAQPSTGSLEINETQVGKRFESAGIAITVLNVKTVNSLSGMGAGAGKTYFDIEILIENVSRDEETPYNPLYFKVKDPQYLEYNTALVSLDPSLTSGDLVKGDKVRGHVAFEVPAEAKKFVVSYVPMVLFGGYQTISINIVLP